MWYIFVDTAFYIALIYTDDEDHELALRLSAGLQAERVRFVTSEPVLFEVFAFVSRLGPRLRARAVALMRRLQASQDVEIVRPDDATLRSAIDLFESRLDQRYSLTDCTSMIIARQRRISDVLTSDRDFKIEGFNLLMELD